MASLRPTLRVQRPAAMVSHRHGNPRRPGSRRPPPREAGGRGPSLAGAMAWGRPRRPGGRAPGNIPAPGEGVSRDSAPVALDPPGTPLRARESVDHGKGPWGHPAATKIHTPREAGRPARPVLHLAGTGPRLVRRGSGAGRGPSDPAIGRERAREFPPRDPPRAVPRARRRSRPGRGGGRPPHARGRDPGATGRVDERTRGGTPPPAAARAPQASPLPPPRRGPRGDRRANGAARPRSRRRAARAAA